MHKMKSALIAVALAVSGCDRVFPPSGFPDVAAAVSVGNEQDLLGVIRAGKDVNAPGDDGEYPIEKAVKLLKIEKIEILLQNGANANQVCKDGGVVLNYAVVSQNHRIVELFLKAGAKPDYSPQGAASPIQIAEEMGDQKLVELLRAN